MGQDYPVPGVLPKSHGGRKVSHFGGASSCKPANPKRRCRGSASRFRLPSHLNNVYSVKVTNESAGGVAAATSREFASGQKVFGRYTLVKVLGRGGVGNVWLAPHEKLEGDGALKFFPDLSDQDRVVVEPLKRGATRFPEVSHS